MAGRPFRNRLALAALGTVLCLGILEAGLRTGASVLRARHERASLAALRQKGGYRILCLGESTTYSGYPPVLGEVLNSRSDGVRFAVIDGGIPAVGTGFILEHLEEDLDRYRPDMVIAMMGINDELEILAYKSGTGLPLLDSLRVVQLARLAWLRLRAGLGWPPSPRFRPRPEGLRPVKLVVPDPQDALLRQAEELRLKEGPGPAAALLGKALAASPRPYRIHYELGRIRAMTFSGSLAEASFRKAIRLEPKDQDARRELARLYTQQKRFAQAEALYRELAALAPGAAATYLELGQMLVLSGAYAEAEASLLKARKLAPEEPAVLAALAIAAGAKGDRKAERGWLRELEKMGLTFYNSLVRDRYRELKNILDRRGVRLVCAQYPMLSLTPLKSIFLDQPDTVFVDNERVFREAVARDGYPAYFEDMFAGDFGHCTDRGARLLAENIAETVVRELGLTAAVPDR